MTYGCTQLVRASSLVIDRVRQEIEVSRKKQKDEKEKEKEKEKETKDSDREVQPRQLLAACSS
eukprot:1319257-Amorphochlora_amoeboformis.AAC.1